MIVNRIERIRLYPNARQTQGLRFMLDVTRQLYNAALQERRDAYRLRGVSISAKTQYRELTTLRDPATWLDTRVAAVYRECEDAVIHRLDLAMQVFFRRCKRGETPGFPRFKAAVRWRQIMFSHGERALKFDATQSKVAIPGIGPVKLRKGRNVPEFGRAWLVERNERWYACFECERTIVPLLQSSTVLGVDRGVHVLAALSDGTLIPNAAIGEKRKNATKRLQRELDDVSVFVGNGRGRRCINRRDPKRIAAVKRLARAKEREGNARRDYAHKAARRIVDRADVIGVEALQLRNMTRSAKGSIEAPGRNVAAKAGLNRVVLDAGFGLLEQMILAKAEEAGRRVVRVDPRFSSQECSHCGRIARESRRRRRYVCVACGYQNHADVNAALVIRGRAQSVLTSELTPAEDAGRCNHKVAA
ncbi:MAG: RNA-guided endonuclease InsQ/TnpB family protein [Acidobacteriaceae bacterium]